MNSRYVTSKEKLLSLIGKKYTSMSESASIDKGIPILIGIPKPAKHEETAYKALKFYEQESWKLEIKRYSNANASLKLPEEQDQG